MLHHQKGTGKRGYGCAVRILEKVVNRKNGELSSEPDKKDDYVYTDEYLNYLIER